MSEPEDFLRQKTAKARAGMERYYDAEGAIRPNPLSDEELAQELAGASSDTTQPEPGEDVPAEPEDTTPPAGPDDQPEPIPLPDQSGVDPEAYRALEQRFRTLQGKYNAEVGGLNERLRALETRPAPAAEPVPAKSEALQALSEAERTEWGPDLVEIIGRRAYEIVNPLIQELRGEIRQLTSSVTHAETTARAAGRSALQIQMDGLVTGWEKINTSQAFINWLAEPDPLAGVPRQVLIDNAVRDSDAPRIARFFQTYKASGQNSPAPTPSAPADTTRAPVRTVAAPGGGTPGRVDPAHLVLPERSRSSSAVPNATANGVTPVTASEMKKFSQDKLRGVYRNRPQEAKAIQDRINAAIATQAIQVQ